MRRFLDWVRTNPPIREGARQILTRLSIHHANGVPDIVIFSCRRSGSTWLMELLAASPNVRFVNEPFIPSLVQKAKLPTGLEGQLPPQTRKIVDVPPDRADTFRRHLVKPAATRVRGPYNLFSPQYHAITHRRVLKIVHATAIADWIVAQPYPVYPVYLVRHPIATAVSMSHSNIASRAAANLHHSGFCAKYLDEELVDYAWEVLRSGSELDKFVLEWCLDNLVPYRTWQAAPAGWTFLTYEELMLEPARSLALVGRNLELSTERGAEIARVPSASTVSERRADIATAPSGEWLVRWRQNVDQRLEDRAFQIVNRFRIDVYEPGRTVASEPFLHFLETPRL